MKKTPVKESRGFHGFDPLPPRGRPVSKELIDKLRREGMAEAEAIEEELDADLYLQEISRKLTEKFGDLNEGRTLASMREVLYQRFGMEVTAPRARAWNGDRSMEVGLLAYSGRRDEVFVVEVTNHLREEDLDRMRRMLHELRDFFPGYGGKKLHGILAADDAPEDVREKVLQEGIYLARVHDGHFELQVPEDFQPRAF